MMNPLRMIAIDASGAQLFTAHRLPSRQFILGAVPTVPENLDAYLKQQQWLGIRAVAYEDCYFGVNTQTYAKLTAVKTRVEEAARKAGLNFTLYKPSEWQAWMLYTRGENSKTVNREKLKPRAMELAETLLMYPPPSNDYADAVCLWHYAAGLRDRTYATLRGLEQVKGKR